MPPVGVRRIGVAHGGILLQVHGVWPGIQRPIGMSAEGGRCLPNPNSASTIWATIRFNSGALAIPLSTSVIHAARFKENAVMESATCSNRSGGSQRESEYSPHLPAPKSLILRTAPVGPFADPSAFVYARRQYHSLGTARPATPPSRTCAHGRRRNRVRGTCR